MAILISDDFTVRPGTWIGSAVSVGGLSWVCDRAPPGYWAYSVRTSGVGLVNSDINQSSSGYIPSTLLTNNDCQIDVTFNVTAAATYYDSIWVWFNVYPEYIPGAGGGIQSAYDGSGFSPMCGIRLYPRDTNANNAAMYFYGQLQDAAGGSGKYTTIMPVGMNTIRIYVDGVDVFLYLNGVLLTSTQDTVFFNHWSTSRRFHAYPGVGLQWENYGGFSGRLMPTSYVVSGTLAAPSQFWTKYVKSTEVDT